MTTVDLGCGSNKRGDVGVDVVALPGVDHVVHLGFEALPFEDESIDKFVAHDFLEHVPMCVWVERGGKIVRLTPVIYLLNEVWRCLRRGGRFEHATPVFAGMLPVQEVWQDPTHVSVWTAHTMQYFCGGFGGSRPGGLPAQYGIKCEFRETLVTFTDTHMHWAGVKP
jgi:hypothetical protein